MWGASGFQSYCNRKTHHLRNARLCLSCGNGSNLSGHFWAAATSATVLELLQRVRQVLGESQHALRSIRRALDTREAGYFLKASTTSWTAYRFWATLVMTRLRGYRRKSLGGKVNDMPAVLRKRATGLSSLPSPDFDLVPTDVPAETLYGENVMLLTVQMSQEGNLTSFL
jgi:hypothetical protein